MDLYMCTGRLEVYNSYVFYTYMLATLLLIPCVVQGILCRKTVSALFKTIKSQHLQEGQDRYVKLTLQ